MATDPWARFDSVLNKSKPPDPWKRFDAALGSTTPGPWEATASPLVQRRRMPDGSYETRPTPREGQEPAVTPAPRLMPSVAGGTRQVLTRAAEGTASLGDIINVPVEALARAVKYASPPRDPRELMVALTSTEKTTAMGDVLYGDLADERQRLRDAYQAERDKAAEMLRDVPVLAAVSDATLDLVSDPTNLIPGGAGKVVLREVSEEAVQRAAREAASLVPRVDDLAEYTAEELADLAARKRGMARLGPDIERTMPAEPPPVRLGAGIPDAEIEQRLGMRASPEDAEELRRLSLPIGEEPLPDTLSQSSPWSRFDDELARATEPSPVPPPGGRGDAVEIPRPEPRGTAVTERGSRVDFDYEIRDASTLVTSHDDVLRPNPLYPPEVQPRERGRAASAAQVVRIEQQLNPELLGPSPRVSDGAPFIGPDGVVESGNARSIALRRAYAAESPRAGAYRDWVREQAPRLGLDPAAADAVPNPVLVRVRRTDVDRAAFAREANESAVSGFSAAERAAADANLVTPGMLDSLTLQADGSVNLQTNRDFIRAFAAQVAPTEHATMFDARGQLSLDGERRLQNAILAKAYGDPAAVAKLTEHADSNVRAVGSALMREAPRFARLREGVAAGRLYPLDISEDVAAALRKLSTLRDEGMKTSDYLAQGSLFGSDLTPEARTLLVLFDANARSGSRVADILGRYADSVSALGDPAQVRMFGEQSVPSRLELLTAAAPPEQRALLSQAEASYLAAGASPPPSQAAQAVLPAPSRRAPGGLPPQGDLPGIPSPSSTPLRMSTKGVENVAGLRDDLRRVVEANRPEIEAARGPVVPVSQWHDAPALAEKLGLAPEDYLRRPADRGPMNADELSLGRHYLGQMKKEALDLEARIAAGDVPDRAAAEAEKVARNRDVVRMMATLQGQGSSENARAMRSLQEALDPYGLADTPRDRVRLALLKKYKEANAGEAARLEAAAVARLKRQAARETRKASRQATAAELGDELGQLAERFGQISRSQIGRGAPGGIVPIDPELVEVVGKMAANRVRAGVVAVEELADQVYTAVSRQVDGISREQVKAAIVEHALARPAKTEKLPRDPAAAKLRAREQALARQVEKAEQRLASGPQIPQAKAAPADSPRLQELRQRLDEVRAQLAADPREGLAARYRELLDDQTIEMIATLPDPAEDPEALLDFLRLMERPTWKDYAGAYAYNNLLSGPKSLLRNVVGNTVKRWDRIAMQPLSAGIEHVLARQQGRLPERYVREVLPMVVGSYQGAPEALQKGLWVLKHGWDPERVVGELTGVKGSAKYYEGRLPVDPFLLSQNKAVRAIGAVHGYGPRLMQVGDVMARTRNFSSATHAWATRTAINDVKRGVATDVAARAAELLREQPEEMIEYAQRVAREDTFQDEVSGIAKLIGAGRREDTGAGFLLNQAVRFLNVPDRIMAWLADYTPGLRIAGSAWKGGKLRKAWGTPEASDILARQAFGTALAGAAAAWAFQGKLVGNAPRDEKLRNDFYATGKQPNSVLVGGRWVPIRDLFGGWAGPVVAAAAFHDSAMTGEPVDGEELLRRAGGAALGEARFLLDAGYLSTLSDTVSAIQAEPDQAGGEMAGLAARTAAGALVPWSGLQRNVAITLDPRVVDKEGPLDEVKAGIPGLRQTLPARIGTLGEELRQSTGAAGGILPVVPTRNRVADPGLAEDVERMRATLTERRREIGRVEKDIKDARRAKDVARVRELQAFLPRGASTARLDNIMESIRVQEMRIRKLRASGKPEDVIRRAEVEIQKRMAERLEKALAGLSP